MIRASLEPYITSRPVVRTVSAGTISQSFLHLSSIFHHTAATHQRCGVMESAGRGNCLGRPPAVTIIIITPRPFVFVSHRLTSSSLHPIRHNLHHSVDLTYFHVTI